MKKSIKKILLPCTLALFAGTLSATLFTATAQGSEPYTEFTVQERYCAGDTLSTEAAEFISGAQRVKAEAVLVLPDGRAYTGDSFRLEQPGQYELELSCRLNGAKKKVKQTFVVGEAAGSFSKKGGSYELTEKGLEVVLNDGNKFTVNQTVDISSATADDEIVTVAVTPRTVGAADFKKITVTLTDEADPDVYLKVLLQASPSNPAASYALAGGTNQALTGYEKEWDRIHKNNQWGSYIPFTFYGKDAFTEFGIRYDAETKKVYALEGREIIDLDDAKFFPNKFEGFKSNQVRVSVECASFESKEARFTVKKLMGERIVKSFIADETAPVLTVEDENAHAEVGKKFPLYESSALDDASGEVAVRTDVYYHYGMANEYVVDSLDGYFIPDRTGIYTIVYTARDAFGNTAKKVAEVEAREHSDALSVALLASGDGEGELGREARLATLAVSGGSGKSTVSAVAVLGEERLEIQGGAFLPERAGDYEIVLTATDRIGNTATYSYPFKAYAGEKPFFTQTPQLPRFFIEGKQYIFRALPVSDYTSGERRDYGSDIYLTQNGRTLKVTDGVPVSLEGEGVVTVSYRAGGAELQKNVPLVRVEKEGKLDIGKYFYTQGEVSVSSSGTTVAAREGDGVQFIRELLAEEMTVRFDVGAGGIRTLRLTLTDSLDETVSVPVLLQRRGNGYAMSVNGVTLCERSDAGFTENSASNEFNLLYRGGAIACDGVTLYSLSAGIPGFQGFPSGRVYLEFFFEEASEVTFSVKNINRQPTNSVTADRIPPKIVLNGNYGGEKLLGEEVVLAGADALDVLDTTLTFTLSVFAPDGVTCVTDEEGRLLRDVDGKGSYRFRVTEYGSYKIVYTARDGAGFRDGTLTYVLPVEDKIAPVVQFKKAMKASYKAGETIVLPDYAVSDNLDSAEAIAVYRYLTTPSGRNIALEEGTGSLKLTGGGTYRYCVTAYDGAGNVTMEQITFRVTE